MNAQTFQWPNGKRAALSLTFDDARLSQVDTGLALLDAHGVKATFYVTPSAMMQRLDGWQRAVANGHEIGNHTVTHPCSGNFPWARARALEDFTLERMAKELDDANRAIEDALGVHAQTFAYPCGQTFVGRGAQVKSYVPLVAERFLAARGYPNEGANDPVFCDLNQLFGRGFDTLPFERVKEWLEITLRDGHWLVLAGHEIGESETVVAPEGGVNAKPAVRRTRDQTVLAATLEQICRFAREQGIWSDTVANVARHVMAQRKAMGIKL